ncbi:MAG: hypothetical protein EOP44_06105 [Sphingobacteriaceae bacterium]|nr:MAG: hypothetical protein EOP44_06105 [Sphingobacteriaceae bacterium]
MFKTEQSVAWIADDPRTGDKFLAVFNPTDGTEPKKININLNDLGFKSKVQVKNLWNHQNSGNFSGEFTPEINAHGAGLYRISSK